MKIVIAGVTGWVGQAIFRKAIKTPGVEVVAGVSRSRAGEDMGTALGLPATGIAIVGTLDEALNLPSDVVIDYTNTEGVRTHAPAVIRAGRALVIGTSGLDEIELQALDALARQHGVGVVAAGNFSISGTLLKRFALEAARYLADVEVVEYASARKQDVPTGTGRELAEALSALRQAPTTIPLEKLQGLVGGRGVPIGSGSHAVQLHSVYLPSYVLAVESIHATESERLVIRHEAGSSAQPYVAGTLLAARAALTLKGLLRGLESLI
ncbi:4-hydroxy-tetrahydrodipicolinate reductase [Pseudomonas sp. AK106]